MREYSRLLRKNQTETETTFWNIVRKRQFYGFRFDRQYVLHAYILDFVCFKKLLVIEFDGQQHLDNKEYLAPLPTCGRGARGSGGVGKLFTLIASNTSLDLLPTALRY